MTEPSSSAERVVTPGSPPNGPEMENGRDILVENMTLFHGSGTAGIQAFNLATEQTIGSGVYFTSDEQNAIGYARGRARQYKTDTFVLYKVEVNNVRLANLGEDEHVARFMGGFKVFLERRLLDPTLDWIDTGTLRNAIAQIKAGTITARNIKDATFSHSKKLTEYLQSLGYDGLAAREGGEGDYVGRHDSYVIFKPEKVKIIDEKLIEDTNT